MCLKDICPKAKYLYKKVAVAFLLIVMLLTSLILFSFTVFGTSGLEQSLTMLALI